MASRSAASSLASAPAAVISVVSDGDEPVEQPATVSAAPASAMLPSRRRRDGLSGVSSVAGLRGSEGLRVSLMVRASSEVEGGGQVAGLDAAGLLHRLVALRS